jgi:hypothetical protein
MPRYEYKVVPAPTKGRRAKGVRGAEARFSHALESVMNDLAREGWEYQRTETLPSVERSGLTSTSTQWRNLMIFPRPHPEDVEDFAPELLPAPEEKVWEEDFGEDLEDAPEEEMVEDDAEDQADQR